MDRLNKVKPQDAGPASHGAASHGPVSHGSVGTGEPASGGSTIGFMAIWMAIGGAAIIVLGAILYQGTLPPLRGREFADPLTVQLAVILDLIARLAMLATLGLLVTGLAYSPGASHHQIGEQGRRWVRRAGSAAAVWFGASVLLVPVTAGENNGVSLSTAMAALGPFLGVTQAAAAWLFPAAVALLIILSARQVRTVGGGLALLGLTTVWQLAPVVTGNVSVGADHDFGTDAAILASIAGVFWIANTIAAVIAPPDGEVRRFGWLSAAAATVVVAGLVVVGWYELAGTPALGTGYGGLTLASIIVWVVLAIGSWVSVLRHRRGTGSRTFLSLGLALAVLGVGLQTAMAHVAPPRFLVPQTSGQINYLGYEVNQEPTLALILSPGRPNLLLVALGVAAIVTYLVAWLVLRHRGITWPVMRVVAWVFGWMLLLWVATAGVWAYSGATFSYHMLVHMLVSMLVPVLIVLGGPITLALRVLPTTTHHGLPSARDLLNGLVNWKPLEILMHPIVIGLIFISGLYAIYFSDLFGYLMRFHWGHQLMTFHFLISGVLFFGLLVGADRNPRELPHVAKLGFLFAAMPFHAFFAVVLLQSEGIIAENYYRSLDVAWMGDLLADQQNGGQITWAMGELPMIVVVIALVFQWFAQDRRDARRIDRALDDGHDDAFEAYNDMLKKLSERADR